LVEKLLISRHFGMGAYTKSVTCWTMEENILSYRQFQIKYPNNRINFLTYMGVIGAIKKYQRNINIALTPKYTIRVPKVWLVIGNGNASIQTVLRKETTAAGVIKWDRYFFNLNWDIIFRKIRKSTTDTKLQWFQFRILHRILPTGRYLFMRKVIESPQCVFCGQFEETIEHLLWDCKTVKDFWNEWIAYVKEKCHNCQNLRLTKSIVLFGVEINTITDNVMDFLILLAKYYVYSCKWNNTRPMVNIFCRIAKSRFKVEKYINTIKGTTDIFRRAWLPYLELVN